VEGLEEYKVKDEWDCFNLLQIGEKNTFHRQTHLNQ
jgi:hypothetical protein